MMYRKDYITFSEREAEEVHRRTYEPCDVGSILRGLGKESIRYSREMKSWRDNADGSASVYCVRTEAIFEAFIEYSENAEW